MEPRFFYRFFFFEQKKNQFPMESRIICVFNKKNLFISFQWFFLMGAINDHTFFCKINLFHHKVMMMIGIQLWFIVVIIYYFFCFLFSDTNKRMKHGYLLIIIIVIIVIIILHNLISFSWFDRVFNTFFSKKKLAWSYNYLEYFFFVHFINTTINSIQKPCNYQQVWKKNSTFNKLNKTKILNVKMKMKN